MPSIVVWLRQAVSIHKQITIVICIFQLDNVLMTLAERWEKRNWFLFIIGYFAIGYVLINWVNESRAHYFDVAFGFESSIPFVSFFILGYLFVYVSMLVLYFLIDDIRLWRRAVVSFLFLTSVCYAIFLLLPVKMTDRPEVREMVVRTIFDQIARFYFVVDRPFNALPSIHASYPMLATLLVWRTAPVGRWVLVAMTAIIAVSVVLVKQHYIMDVTTGIFAAFICYYVVLKTEHLWHRWFWKGSP